MTSHLVELVLFVLLLFLLFALFARLVAVGQTDHRQPLGVRLGVADAALVAVDHLAVTRRQLQQQEQQLSTTSLSATTTTTATVNRLYADVEGGANDRLGGGGLAYIIS